MFLVREMVILQKSKNNTLLEIKDFNALKKLKNFYISNRYLTNELALK